MCLCFELNFAEFCYPPLVLNFLFVQQIERGHVQFSHIIQRICSHTYVPDKHEQRGERKRRRRADRVRGWRRANFKSPLICVRRTVFVVKALAIIIRRWFYVYWMLLSAFLLCRFLCIHFSERCSCSIFLAIEHWTPVFFSFLFHNTILYGA